MWICGLLANLAKLQIHGRCLKWLKGFLCDRSLCFRIGNYLIEFCDLVERVLLDSILSPLLFNAMISDFPDPSPKITTLYADDVAKFFHAWNSYSAESTIQPLFDLISALGLKWKLNFSISKSISSAPEDRTGTQSCSFPPIPVESFQYVTFHGVLFDA